MEESCWFDTMGNLHDVEDFMTLWTGAKAKAVRDKVANCPKSCWMIGSASPVMKKYITKVAPWVLKINLRLCVAAGSIRRVFRFSMSGTTISKG